MRRQLSAPPSPGRAAVAREGDDSALPGDARWQELVELGRHAKRSQWALGDAALEIRTIYGQGSLQRYAEEIGENPTTLGRYKTVAAAYDENARGRANVSFAIYDVFRLQPDRLDLIERQPGWGQREARALVRERARRTDPRAQAADRRAERQMARDRRAESQYQAMVNGVLGSVNNPLIKRAEKVEALIVELSNFSPEDAASQIPGLRCRQFTSYTAEWWQKFVAACEQRIPEGHEPVKRSAGRAADWVKGIET